MKKVIITAFAASLAITSAAPVLANGWGKTTNVAKGGHATGVGVGIGQGGTGGVGLGGGADTDVNIGPNTTSHATNISSSYDTAAYSPDVIVSDCQWGLSAGVPGAVAGLGIPGKHCRVLVEAELIEYYWGKQAAGQHLYDNNNRIRKTIQKRGQYNQPVTSVSTRSRTTSQPVVAMRGEDR